MIGFDPIPEQMGGSCHDAEVHMVHVKQGTDDELLVVGILMDATDFGENIEVRRSNKRTFFLSRMVGGRCPTTVCKM